MLQRKSIYDPLVCFAVWLLPGSPSAVQEGAVYSYQVDQEHTFAVLKCKGFTHVIFLACSSHFFQNNGIISQSF